MEKAQNIEPILQESNDRFVLFPIQHENIWRMYKDAVNRFWVAEEIVLAKCHRIETNGRPSFVMTLTLYPSSLQAKNASYLIFGCVT